eukprot:m.254955 g.254955  ORF g.254955 m.254955 type:complete len:399 (+) comp19235_c0_seq1:227-1423(+)
MATLWSLVIAMAACVHAACDVTHFGAIGDNHTEDTLAIQRALDSPACDVVVLPAPGKFLARSLLTTVDNQTLIVEAGAMLIAWPDPDTWSNITNHTPPLIASRGSHMLSGYSITGGGTIDGQGWRWWPFGKTRSRPILINMFNVSTLALSQLRLIDAPMFNIQVRGKHMRITNITIYANSSHCDGYLSAPNTDGINIGGQDIYVADSFIHNGDDCIPTNTALDGDTQGVLVERVHCECGTNGGVPIIANNRAIRDVVYQDMTLVSLNQGAGMKISEPYDTPTGLVANVTWRRLTIHTPRNAAIYADTFQEDAFNCVPPSNPNRTNWLTADHLVFEDIFADGLSPARPAGCFLFSSLRPATNLVFNNVTALAQGGSPARPYVCFNAHGSTTASVPAACT